MRLEGAIAYLLLMAAAVSTTTAAVERNSPLRKRSSLDAADAPAATNNNNNDGTKADTPAAIGADTPAAAAASESAAAIDDNNNQEEDIRLLKLDDALYWKKFIDHDGSMAAPSAAPTGEGCTFDVDIDCELKFSGGNMYRDCDDAFLCSDDITEQTYQYLGGECATVPANVRGYECRTYDNPGLEDVRLLVVYGDFFDDLKRSERGTYAEAIEFLNGKTFVMTDQVISAGEMFTIDVGDPLGLPDDVDNDELTYAIYEDTDVNGEIRVLATWEWECSGRNAGRYSLFDLFANSELMAFESQDFGEVKPYDAADPMEAQVKFTTTLENECGADGMVVFLDRQLCYRDFMQTQYTCDAPTTLPVTCVFDAQYTDPQNCMADVPGGTGGDPIVLARGEDVVFVDNLIDMIEVREGREYQYRIPEANVYFKTEPAQTVRNLDTREEWFFGGTDDVPSPPGEDCDFDISDIQCQVSFDGGNDFRICEDAWDCTEDMTSQTFVYLGDGCADSSDRGDPVGYDCDTFDGGPDDVERMVMIVQGDYFDDIIDDMTITEARDAISDANPNGDFGDTLRLMTNAEPGDILTPQDFERFFLRTNDNDFLTYLVFQNEDDDEAEIRMKAVWKWNCEEIVDDPFEDETSEYSIYDDFANLQLTRFQSDTFGDVGETSSADVTFKYTFDNECAVPGEILVVDRELCQRRGCDGGGWNCPDDARSDCVVDGILQDGCTAMPDTDNPVILGPDPDGQTMIFDVYEFDFRVAPDIEYRLRLLNTEVRYNNIPIVDEREEAVFSFCASDSVEEERK
eukprot:CAMPEP_0178573108 /NCGR_PEP_ID=MMETSP0697-20121206/18595_1 /TAXON_ID=265572 /ORGANISM="Extubocellulus spinifer, Strain CCMP396" /LENGTH=798 /DNA_ID=CAMNT_0020207911 /DNA_START=96 /DNA_END=2492 /DNA_ORIENTATION=+